MKTRTSSSLEKCGTGKSVKETTNVKWRGWWCGIVPIVQNNYTLLLILNLPVVLCWRKAQQKKKKQKRNNSDNHNVSVESGGSSFSVCLSLWGTCVPPQWGINGRRWCGGCSWPKEVVAGEVIMEQKQEWTEWAAETALADQKSTLVAKWYNRGYDGIYGVIMTVHLTLYTYIGPSSSTLPAERPCW